MDGHRRPDYSTEPPEDKADAERLAYLDDLLGGIDDRWELREPPSEQEDHYMAEDVVQGKRQVSTDIYTDLLAWGYNFWMNDLDDSIYVGAERFTDAERAKLRMKARDEGYAKRKLLSALDDAVLAFAAQNRRHPIRDYLNALVWDGEDHIAGLAAYFKDKHDPIVYADGTKRTVFHAFLRRWLIGSVAKIMGDRDACMGNTVLVLEGVQGKGKSHFAAWLCPLPKHHKEGAVAPDNKDHALLRATLWIWELGELGSVTRRADVDALKSFITESEVVERQAYGHYATVKPVITSYVGSVNSDGRGYLVDKTGNRRFAVVNMDSIKWAYSADVDIEQVWAQAVQLWKDDPKGFNFSSEEAKVRDGNAEAAMQPDTVADTIARFFVFDPQMANEKEWRMSGSEILDKLRTYGGLARGNDNAQGRELAAALKQHWGVEGKPSNGRTVYRGLRFAPEGVGLQDDDAAG